MTRENLKAGTRNAEVYLYEEDDGSYMLSISGPGLTAEYTVSPRFADQFEDDWIDGDRIRQREQAGDW